MFSSGVVKDLNITFAEKSLGPADAQLITKCSVKVRVHFVSISFISLKFWVISLLNSEYQHVNHLRGVCLKAGDTRLISPKFTYPTSLPFETKDTNIRGLQGSSAISGHLETSGHELKFSVPLSPWIPGCPQQDWHRVSSRSNAPSSLPPIHGDQITPLGYQDSPRAILQNQIWDSDRPDPSPPRLLHKSYCLPSVGGPI